MISPRTQIELLASLCFLIFALTIVGKIRPHLTAWRISLAAGFVAVIGLTQTASLHLALFQALLVIGFGGIILHLRTPGSARWPLAGVLVACLLVAFFSGEKGAGGAFRTYLVSLGLSTDAADTVTLTLRKAVHLSFYGTVSTLTYLSCLQVSRSKAEAIVRGLLIALCLASFDEFRQTLASGRGGALTDVGIDLAGAIVGLALAHGWARVRRKFKPVANS